MQAGAGLYFENGKPCSQSHADNSGTGQVHREAGSLILKKNQEKVKRWMKMKSYLFLVSVISHHGGQKVSNLMCVLTASSETI